MKSRYHIVKNISELRQLIECCKQTKYASVDFETSGDPLYTYRFYPTILSVTFQAGSGVSIPLDHFEMSKKHPWKKWLRIFGREVIENPEITKIGYNWKFDNQIFVKYGIYARGTVIDAMLAKYILNENRPNGLKEMVKRYLPDFSNYEKALEDDDGNTKIKWDQIPLEELCKYGCLDTDCTYRLGIFFEKKLIDLNMYHIFRNLYMPMSRVAQDIERNGLYLNRDFNTELLNSYKPKIDQALEDIYNLPKIQKLQKAYTESRVNAYLEKLQQEIDELDADNPKDSRKIASREQKIAKIAAGEYTTKNEKDLVRKINLGSPIDLPWVMYEAEKGLNFPVLKYSDKGRPSTDEETLVNLRMEVKKPDSPKAIFLDRLLELRGLQKMYKTYIEGWHEKVQDDSRLHGTYLIHGCVTGNTKLVGKEKDIRIKDICPSEVGVKDVTQDNLWVLSHEGTWEQITHTINKGIQPMFKITTSRGDILKCTKEHKLLTPQGWKKVSYIFKHKLNVIMYDTSKFDITKPDTGKSSLEVIFRDIPGWEGYLASNEGKVYSVKVAGSRGILDYNHPHELVPRDWGKRGRLRVYLRNNTRKKYAFSISHLIWMAFNNQDNIPLNMVVDHINCNPYDNRPENLQLISYSENIRRAYKCTRSVFRNGANNGSYKITTQQVGAILEDYQNGLRICDIYRKYHISQAQAQGIVKSERRKDIYLAQIIDMSYIGDRTVYDLSVNNNHSYITRSNFINSNTTSGRWSCVSEDTLVLTNMGEIPISELQEYMGHNGELQTLTQEGWKSIEWFIYKGRHEMYEVTLEDGKTIQCTLDHKFITNQGTKKLRELKIRDNLISYTNLSFINTPITQIRPVGVKGVYDLSIKDCPQYIGNGILNHNSKEPNMQQIPKTSVDPNIKKQLVAEPGTLYFVMDYSQAELRIMAHLSGDETYLEAFAKGQDPHLAIAAQKYGVSYDEAHAIYSNEEHPDYKIWKTRRKQAKQIVFGLIYGIQAKLLSVKLSDPKSGIIVTPEEAQQMQDEFFEQHPKIHRYMAKQERILRKQGYITSLFGTKRRLPEVYSDDNAEAAYAIRLAVNFPCQGAASHMTQFGAILVYWDMKQGKYPPMKEVATVHDALYYNTPPNYINTWTVWKIWDTLRNPLTKKYFGFQIDDVTMSMDVTIGRTMAEELPFIPGYDYRKMLQPDFDVDAYMEEHKKFKGIDISEYPVKFKELFEQGKKWQE